MATNIMKPVCCIRIRCPYFMPLRCRRAKQHHPDAAAKDLVAITYAATQIPKHEPNKERACFSKATLRICSSHSHRGKYAKAVPPGCSTRILPPRLTASSIKRQTLAARMLPHNSWFGTSSTYHMLAHSVHLQLDL